MIKWKLAEVMARYQIASIALANELGISANSMSNLKTSDRFPRIDHDRFDAICVALSELSKVEIQPSDLLEYQKEESNVSAIN